MNTVDMSRLENFVSNQEQLTHRTSASLHCIASLYEIVQPCNGLSAHLPTNSIRDL